MKGNKKKGFALIELLVVIGIVILISAVGLINYLDINRNQVVTQETRKVLEMIRFSQNLALSQKKPEGVSCPTLTGYQFRLNNTNGTYTVNAECVDVGATQYLTVKTGNITNVTVDSSSNVIFKVFTKDVLIDDTPSTNGKKLTFTYGNKDRYLVICKGGSITFNLTNPADPYCP